MTREQARLNRGRAFATARAGVCTFLCRTSCGRYLARTADGRIHIIEAGYNFNWCRRA